MKDRLGKIWQGNRFFICFIVLMCLFRSAVADWNSVPTGSMLPTIVEGDRIFVDKLAYDVRLPFTHVSLLKLADPQRGDIIVFDSEVMNKRLVKRVVGIPGDVVEMRNNILRINGEQLVYRDMPAPAPDTDRLENLLGVKHGVRIHNFRSGFHPVTVPEGHYLVLGDNRDNSADSRVIGFVPRHEIVGRSRSVVISFNYENFYLPRPGRFFQSL
ncbi:MAG TPA: signal peptidase I [Gammaproteobacteria bacterium]|jgi:signal peptidase I